jgi:hypothetical protein
MKRKASCLLYLLLNVIISAAVTLTVLVMWERAHPMPVIPAGWLPRQTQAPATPTIQPGLVEEGTPRATFPPGQVLITIENVFSPGTLANELVLIKSSSDVSLPMAGWKLDDGQGNTFIFPVLDLNPGGAVQLHSGPGDNTPIDLYWGLDAPVWQVGKTVTLRDEQGNVRSAFTIP